MGSVMFPYRGLGTVPMGTATEPLGRGFGGFSDQLHDANIRWTRLEADMRGEYAAQLAPYVDTIRLASDVVSKLDFSSVDGLVRTLSGLMSLAGPIGAAAGAILQALDWIADLFATGVPAFAVQIQDQHYAYLDRWIAENVLRIRGGTPEETLKFLYAKGWVPIYAVNPRAFCLNSAGDLGGWDAGGGAAGAFRYPRDAAENVRLFSMIAGPRTTSIDPCTPISELSMAPWTDTDEGRRSLNAGERLANTLKTGEFFPGVFQDGGCKTYQSEGLCFVNNLRLDLDPGVREYNVYVNVILVNVNFLPDALLNPIADYCTLRARAEEAGVYNSTTENGLRAAAFGTSGQTFKSWNLLRLIYGVMRRRGVFPIASVSEAAKRARGPRFVTRTEYTSRDIAQSSSAGISPVAVAGGLGAAGIALWLLLK